MRKILAQGVINLKPGILRFFCWSQDFNPHSQIQTHAQVWVRLMHLPQEYWRKQTLFEISSGVGTPLIIDDATKSRLFGIYARILVDIDMSGKLFDSILVEREVYAFPIEVQYERQPPFCTHCKFLGHSIQQCKKIGAKHGQKDKEFGKRKQQLKHPQIAKKQIGNFSSKQHIAPPSVMEKIVHNGNTVAQVI